MTNREIKFRIKMQSGEWEYFPILYNEETSADLAFADKKTLGLWTGLKDKNGNEIYEGDIVTLNKGTEIESVRIIRYDTNHMVCGIPFAGYDLHDGIKDMQIIGNIYENPELLTKQQC